MKKSKNLGAKIGRKLRLRLTKEQVALFEHHCETTRLLYNNLLEYRRRQWVWLENKHGAWKSSRENRAAFYAEWRENSSFFSDCKQITAALQENPDFAKWARQLPRSTLNIVAESLDNAWQEWMKGKKGAPKFKAKGRGGSFTIQLTGKEKNVVSRDLATINLGTKLGAVKFRDDFYCKNGIKDVASPTPKRITIMKDNRGQWYASVLFDCERRFRDIEAAEKITVGVDVGIAPNFLVTSTGASVPAPRPLEKSLSALARLQRKFSRQLRLSNPDCFAENGAPIRGRRMVISNRAEKTRLQIANLHATIARKREHFLYDTANALVKTYENFIVEDMPISRMMQDGGGHPAIGKFSRGIADASWGKFLEILGARCLITGRKFERVPPQMTTRTCSKCETQSATPIKVRSWTCPKCKTRHNRKINAATNVLERSNVLERQEVLC
jgi:putative transposase